MIEKYKKVFTTTALIISFLMHLDSAFAVESEAAQATTKSSHNSSIEDTDLQLNIEELRKKYPLTIIKKFSDNRNSEKIDITKLQENEEKAFLVNDRPNQANPANPYNNFLFYRNKIFAFYSSDS